MFWRRPARNFSFRLFAIPFLQKLTRLARARRDSSGILLELSAQRIIRKSPGISAESKSGSSGIVAGLVMLRWGIVATLIWHYTVDASLVGLLLIRSDNLYFKISGIVVGLAAVAPLACSGMLYLLRGHFENCGRFAESRGAGAGDQLYRARPAAGASYDYGAALRPAHDRCARFLALCVLVGGLCAWRLKRETYRRLSGSFRRSRCRDACAPTR